MTLCFKCFLSTNDIFFGPIALLHSGCTPSRTCSSLKIHFSAPNHCTYMKLFVYDPNTSKNEWIFFPNFFHNEQLAKKV